MRTVSAASWNVSAPDVDPCADVRSDREGLVTSAAATPLGAASAVRRLRQGRRQCRIEGLGVQHPVSSQGVPEHGGEAEVARVGSGGLSALRKAFMPPHARLLRSLGRHAFRVVPAPPVDHAHRPLHRKVSISRYVSLLWSGRVHGPHPLIIAERPSELKPNAAMFHDASRECPPRDPRILNRSGSSVDEVFRRNQKTCRISGIRCLPTGPAGFEARTLRLLGWRSPAKVIRRQEDVTLSARRGSSQEARLTQRSGGGHDQRGPRTGDLGDLRVHHHPCFCICIDRLDVPGMHAMASP